MDFEKKNNKDNIIHYNYYSTHFYKNQYEKTLLNGDYIKIPYTSQSNQPNILYDNEYTTQNLYISKKNHDIENLEFDGELIIEHISLTNSKKLYTCILLKTQTQTQTGIIFDTPIDRIIQSKQDILLDLNEILLVSSCNEAIEYEPIHSAKVIIFTTPILVSSNFDKFSKLQLFPSPTNSGSIVRMQPILGNVIEGFKEGLGSVTTNVGYCQPIDETDPTIGESAQVIVPMQGESLINEATNTTIRTILNFCAFFAIIIFTVIAIPPLYNLLFVKLIIMNFEFTPQQKLDRLGAVDIILSIILFGISFSLINTGIVNNIPLFTSIGFFIFIFFIACFLLLQFQRSYSPSSAEEFLKQFNENKSEGAVDANFENMKNDLIGLVWDNSIKLVAESVKDESTGKSSIVFHWATILIVLGVFSGMYFMMSWFGITNLPSSSIFLSLPFYLFILSIYLTVLWKIHIQKPLLTPLVKQGYNAMKNITTT